MVSELDGWQTWIDGSGDATISAGEMPLSYGVDVVYINDDPCSDVFELSFAMKIHSSGYFNVGNSGDTSSWDWENQFYFNADGSGSDDFGHTWTYVPDTV